MGTKRLSHRMALPVVAGGLLAAATVHAADIPPRVDTSKPTEVVYPESSQRAGEEGTVIVRVYVTSSGHPTQAAVARSSGFSDLDNAAVETALNWHYVPALHGGDTAADWALVQVVYKLPSSK